jgi:hypothetical protein
VKLYAMANGFTGSWDQASSATKEMYRYQVILQQMAHYQGDYIKTQKSFANEWRQFQANVKAAGETVADYALPSLSELFDSINKFITSINIKDVMENKVIPAIQTFGKIIDDIKNNMKTIIPIISGVVGGLIGFMVIGKVTSEVRDFIKVINNISKLTNPFYLIATGIGLLIAGFINAYNTSDDFREKVNNLFDKIMGFGDYAGNTLPGLLDKLNSVFKNDLQPALDKISKVTIDIFDFVTDHWSGISKIVEIIVGSLIVYKTSLIAVNTWTKIISVTTKAWESIELIIWGIKNATNAWEAAQFALNVVMDANPVGLITLAIAGLIFVVYEVVTHWKTLCGWVSTAWDFLKNNPIASFILDCIPFVNIVYELAKHWDDICSSVQWAWDKLKGFWDWWNGTSFADKTVNITQNVQNTDTVDVDTPTFNPYGNYDTSNTDHNATGSKYFRGGLTTISEFKPEMAILPSGSKILTGDETSRALNSKGTIYAPVIIQGNVIGNEDFKNEVGQHIYNQVCYALMNS